MTLKSTDAGAITTIIDAAKGADTILRIGSLKNCPLLLVARTVLHENFQGFSVYDLEHTSPANPFILFNASGEDHQTWITLMSIVHRRPNIPKDFKVTFSILKQVAALAASFQHRGNAIEEVEWVVTLLKNALPEDTPKFPMSACVDEAKNVGNPTYIFDVLCMAYVFNLPDVFARASRQLMWVVKPEELRKGLVSELAAVLEFDPDLDFNHEFGKANSHLRGYLMEHLPHIFYPDPHADKIGTCFACELVPHSDRWYYMLVERSSHWEAELCGCETCEPSCAKFSLCFDFGDMLAEMEAMSKDVSDERVGCGRFRPRKLAVSHSEMLTELYTNVGGLCLPCFKAGWCSFKTYCVEHAVHTCWY